MGGSMRDIIAYFRKCYQSDNREQRLADVFSKKYELLHLPSHSAYDKMASEGELLLEGKYAEKLYTQLHAYMREKRLYFIDSFMVGYIDSSSAFGKISRQKICAPITYYPVQLETNEWDTKARIDLNDCYWNSSIIRSWLDDSELLDALEKHMSTSTRLNVDLTKLAAWFNENAGALRFEADETYYSEDQLLTLKRKRNLESIKLVRGSAMLIASQSRSLRGILHELELLEGVKEEDHSPPLKQLLGFNIGSNLKRGNTSPEALPTPLSDEQKTTLKNAANRNLSMVIGPPGTGKSYTIAAMAMDRFLQGESVLIVSQTDHAVDVIQKKLISDLGLRSYSTIRAGKDDHHKQLKKFIEKVTDGYQHYEVAYPSKLKLNTALKEVKLLEKEFYRAAKKEVNAGLRLEKSTNDKGDISLIQSVRAWIKNINHLKKGSLHDKFRRVKEKQAELNEHIVDYINAVSEDRLSHAVKYQRRQLKYFQNALKARTSGRQELMFEQLDHEMLLSYLPIWLCTLDSLHQSLPLEEALFDLVIIDEATQCNIPICLPAIQRAKRACIFGDPKQLRHVAFLSYNKQLLLQKEMGIESAAITLNYRDNSIIDLANDVINTQDAVVSLNEHFRSLPEIIGFSNQHYYFNKLRLMTQKPTPRSRLPLEDIKCNGIHENGVNKQEAEQLLAKVKELVASQADIGVKDKLSIGILSFFREQAVYLQEQLFEQISLSDISAHQLRAGTPYSFQGEEKDIMLISTAVDAETVKRSLGYLNKKDMFNVAVTRARDLQMVFTSIGIKNLPNTHQLHSYLQYIELVKSENPTNLPKQELREKYVAELIRELHDEGYDVLPNYVIAGIPMDLVVVHGLQMLVIDLIGFPGEYEDVMHLNRYKLFDRVGVTIFPLSLWDWVFHKQLCIDQIKNICRIEELDIDSFKLTAQSLEGHWYKLMSTDPALAKRVRSVELDLAPINGLAEQEQVGQLLAAYKGFDQVLEKRLDPNELTYSRYKQAVDKVLVAVLGNLEKVITLHNSVSSIFPKNEDHETDKEDAIVIEQKKHIAELLKKNDKAIEQIRQVSLNWANLDAANSLGTDLSQSLNILEQLSREILEYDMRLKDNQ